MQVLFIPGIAVRSLQLHPSPLLSWVRSPPTVPRVCLAYSRISSGCAGLDLEQRELLRARAQWVLAQLDEVEGDGEGEQEGEAEKALRRVKSKADERVSVALQAAACSCYLSRVHSQYVTCTVSLVTCNCSASRRRPHARRWRMSEPGRHAPQS